MTNDSGPLDGLIHAVQQAMHSNAQLADRTLKSEARALVASFGAAAHLGDVDRLVEEALMRAKAQGWDEGYQAACDETPMGYAPSGPTDAENPYRTKVPR